MFTEEQSKKLDGMMIKFRTYQKSEKCDSYFRDAEADLAGFIFAYIIETGSYNAENVQEKVKKLGKGHPAYVYYQKFNALTPKIRSTVLLSCSATIKKLLKEECVANQIP